MDVKVYEEGEDFKRLHSIIINSEKNGLVWNKDLKLIEIAFGMKKLQVSAVVEDDKVTSDDLIEMIELIKWEKKNEEGEIVEEEIV